MTQYSTAETIKAAYAVHNPTLYSAAYVQYAQHYLTCAAVDHAIDNAHGLMCELEDKLAILRAKADKYGEAPTKSAPEADPVSPTL
jgi:hypothetical protein